MEDQDNLEEEYDPEQPTLPDDDLDIEEEGNADCSYYRRIDEL